jgi:hypothetical protein
MTTKLLQFLTLSFSNLVSSSRPLSLPSMPRHKKKPSSVSRKVKSNNKGYPRLSRHSRPIINCNFFVYNANANNVQSHKRSRMEEIEEGVRRVTFSTIEGTQEVYSRDREYRDVPIQSSKFEIFSK